MKSIQSNIKKAKKYLDKNDCVAVPTETVYGLAGNAYSNIAVNKIFNLKKRPKNNPLIVHYSDINKLKDDCHINDNFIKLYNKFSPGPITFILKLKKGSKISKFVTNKQTSLAVRFPKHPLFRKLLKVLNYPLAAPSANISTRLSSVKASDVVEEFGSKIKYVLDGGRCQIGLESTIINLLSKPTILRFGGLDISKIEKTLKKKVLIKTNLKKKIAPGQFPLHYSPGIPLRINAKKSKKNEAFVLIKKRKTTFKNYYYLTKNNNLKQSAKNLYTILRKIKKDGYKMIAVEKIKNKGIGKTINDRLNRASKY
ncbi:L-threonylcarbamoyladenylate synthase [Candidatus Pelagibacter sp.]|jgi:L-threonylcarbamoyladenylate synthase|nr:L-threonylcarbamoyladenylate synthase [Candidatus Pelagibacter sp.]MDB4612835.1 L-threonylcarbamoyladenylate synthase [Candidatus Pelagibacter sp.]MDC0565548.1 L-threonylcarbamoyladenylate synthase [Candidatus Pelagibacter sp.]MDC0981823.1 L-threonylcarbamoyladenylate synthase [Candidatus Pelagibacter sp.]